jgi:hypothetical protein
MEAADRGVKFAESSVRFAVSNAGPEPAKAAITFPRPGERIAAAGNGSTTVQVSLRMINFGPDQDRGDDPQQQEALEAARPPSMTGTFCLSVVGVNNVFASRNCYRPVDEDIVLAVVLSPGTFRATVRLFDEDGMSLDERSGGGPSSGAETVFTVVPPPPPRPPAAPTAMAGSTHARGTGTGADTDISSSAAAGSIAAFERAVPAGGWVDLAVISCRSVDRYHEALVMIKSILHNRRATGGGRDGGAGAGRVGRPAQLPALRFHLIVDAGGRAFFEDRHAALWDLACVQVVFYDYTETCVGPVEQFLGNFGFKLSAHYSGHAGYCRLFLHSILQPHGVKAVIAIESDQIFLENVVDLWEEFARFDSSAAVGMVELYKPWTPPPGFPTGSLACRTQSCRDGVVGDGVGGVDGMGGGDATTSPAQQRGGVGRVKTNPYHGNGYIGGIIMLNFTRMDVLGWERAWRKAVASFLQRAGGRVWSPKLNDQDMFNLVFSWEDGSKWVHTLPCHWNMQYHAWLDQVRVCGEGNVDCAEARRLRSSLCRARPGVRREARDERRETRDERRETGDERRETHVLIPICGIYGVCLLYFLEVCVLSKRVVSPTPNVCSHVPHYFRPLCPPPRNVHCVYSVYV